MKIKTLAFLVIAVFISSQSFGQTDTIPVNNFSQNQFDKEMNFYLKKSRNQKTMAWILLGGGFGLNVISSSLMYNYNEDYPNEGAEILSGVSGLATLGSIPLFFIASKNKNKAQLLSFKKEFALAANDSLRKLIVEDAAEYFLNKSAANKTPAIILSAAGGAFIIAGIAVTANHEPDDVRGFFNDVFVGPAYIASGLTLGLLSIPFYTRAAHHKKTARMLLRSERFPLTEVGSVKPVIKTGRQMTVGIAFQL